MNCFTRGRSFLPASACRHAARTVSSPASFCEVRVPLVQSLRLLTAAVWPPRCLLIVRTRWVVTRLGARTTGSTEFPAYRGVDTDLLLPAGGPDWSSLLSPEYLLSVERRPFHPAPPDH